MQHAIRESCHEQPTRASVTMITVETVARGYGRREAAATGHRANRRLEYG
jgi:hypothetical protein